MTLHSPTYVQDICYTAQDDRLQTAGLICVEGVDKFTSLRVTQQASPTMTVEISAGHIYVAADGGTSAGERGYYHVYNDGVITKTVDAAIGSIRTDTIWLLITDTQYTTGTSGAEIVYRANQTVPDGGSSATWYKLATITVPASPFTAITGYPAAFGATDGQIKDERQAYGICGGSGGLQAVVAVTATQNFVKADYPKGKYIRVRAQAPGGGSGGYAATNAGQASGGGGGGGGEYREAFFTFEQLANSETATIGAVGAAGGSGGNGGNAGDVTFGSLLTSKGGSGGTAGSAFTYPGASIAGNLGAGGTGGTGGTGGYLAIPGGRGGSAFAPGNGAAFGGVGGAAFFGHGVSGTHTNGAIGGVAGKNYGAGSNGGANVGSSQTIQAGAAGGAGIIIIEVFG